jgi:KDO2-lipid IV(A) lauroyltransferase
MARHETPDFRDRLEYAGLASLLAAFRLGSRDAARHGGERLGRFVDRVIPLRREVALANLHAAFPEMSEAERRAVYRRMLENLGVMLAEFARFNRRTPDPPSLSMRVDNPDAFAAARDAGRGALLLTAHFGNWEGLGAMARELGYPVTVLGARQRNPLVEDLFTRYRGRMGLAAITVGKSLKPILKALNSGAFVATLADQDGGPGGFFIDFLGRRASVQPGLFRLIARRGTPLVTGFSWREGDGWRGAFQEPIWPRVASTEKEAETEALRLAAIYTARVEEYVRRHPDHWFWVHRRWRTRPPGEPSAL